MNKVSITINGNLITRTSKIDREDIYNDVNKYMTFTKGDSKNSGNIEKVLLEFPEYVAGQTATITNTGLVVFKNVSTEYGYDLVDLKELQWSGINADFISTTENYTEFNNPLGVRKIYVSKDKKLTGEVYYKTGSQFIFNMDVDGFGSNNSIIVPDDSGIFTYSEYKTNKVYFEYKQSALIKFVNCTGEANNKTMDSDNYIYLDFSDIIPSNSLVYNLIEFKFTSVDENAYVEVR